MSELDPDDPGPAPHGSLAEADALAALVIELHARGKIADAAAIAEHVLAVRASVLGAAHASVADALTTLASLYRLQCRHADAAALGEHALRIHEAALGPDHAHVAISANNLALVYQDLGDHARAEPLLVRALRIHEARGTELWVATALHNLAMLHHHQGADDRAVPLLLRALAIREQRLGAEHPDVAATLDGMASALQALGDHGAALPRFERALAIRERALGAEHPDVARSLNNLAELHQERGEGAAAEPMVRRALAILEASFGPDHPELGIAVNNLAGLHADRGDHAGAERLYQRALDLHERAFGATHPRVAMSLNNLGQHHLRCAAYDRAEPLFRRALDIAEQAWGADHPEVAAPLDSLATLHKRRGAYADAAPLYQRALRVREAALGPAHPEVARSLNNLGALYREQGDDALAEPLYERALQIREQLFGPDSLPVATSLSNLAGLYQAQGAYGRAEELHARALAIRERRLGAEHADVATSLNNLAALHHEQGDHDRAQPHYERALRILHRTLGADHVEIATTLNNLAALHEARGELAEAEQLHLRALGIRERALGIEHPDVAISLINLALLHQAQGAYDRAGPLLGRALAICEAAPVAHPNRIIALSNLAALTWITGDTTRAFVYLARAIALRERELYLTLATLPEARQRQLLQTVRGEADALLSFHARCAPDEDVVLAAVLTVILRSKGRILDEITRARARLRSHLSSTLQDALDALDARRRELARVRDGDETAALARDVDRREAELSRRSAAFRTYHEPLTIGPVQAALPEDAALIEFARYQQFDPRRHGHEWSCHHYAAYAITRDGSPRWVALGDAARIDAAVRAAVRALAVPAHDAATMDDARGHLRALDELVFAPVRRLVGAVDHFLISPDGPLHLVPFGALIDEQGGHAVERMRITYVNSGRDLVRADAPGPLRTPGAPIVIGAPAYRDPTMALAGAAAEAAAVQRHFSDAVLHVGREATRDKLLAAGGGSPRFVHVATHGYVRAPRPAAAIRPLAVRSPTMPGARDVVLDSLDRLAQPVGRADIEDALDDTGLMFSDIDDPDATLTARAVARIDLRSTRLVVLSACDTGIGELAHTEGLYGLRRALIIAGVETLVLSLWKVDDIATGELMDRYYARLRGGEGRSEALRHAQLGLLREPRYAHPYYWAAFVAIGDERPL